ncbi:MAG: hypothetical protein VX327_04280, partial [Actinomycetota bacterium]|nr:hypothetical protein [Actinomycetota bacterium]
MADDSISEMVDGALVGMDGEPLRRLAGKSDYALRDAKCKSVCEPVEPAWRRSSQAAASKALGYLSYAAVAAPSTAPTTMIGDSAAGEIFHTQATGASHLLVVLGDGSHLSAVGGDHIFMWMTDDGGARHLVDLGPAYRMMVPDGTRPLQLLSFPALKRIGFRTVLAAEDDGSYVQDRNQRRFPLKWNGQIWTMPCEIAAGGTVAAPAVTTPSTATSSWSPHDIAAAPETVTRSRFRTVAPTNLQQAMADSVAADGIKEDSSTSPPTRQRLTGDDTETTRTAQWGSETGVAFAKEQMISSHVLRKTASNQIRVGGTAVQSKRREPVHYAALPPAGADADIPAADIAAAQHKLAVAHENYRRLHIIFNHCSSTVDALIQQGLATDASRPGNFHCPACMVANARSVSFSPKVVSDFDEDRPWAVFQVDIWGPFDCGAHERYVWGAICCATGESWIQPIAARSEAVLALEAFFVWFDSVKRSMERARGLPHGTVELRVIQLDKAGEHTNLKGRNETEHDSAIRRRGIRPRFNTTDLPQSGTTKIESLWDYLSTKTRAAFATVPLAKDTFFSIMCLVNRVRNLSPTLSNRIGGGEAPWHTLRRHYDLASIPIPGALATIIRKPNRKTDPRTEIGIVIGVNSDGHGYIIRTASEDEATMNCRISTDIQTVLDMVNTARANPAEATPLMRRAFNLDGVYEWQLSNDTTKTDTVPTTQPSRRVGATPGDGGSRLRLARPRDTSACASSNNGASGLSHAHTLAEARKLNAKCIWKIYKDDGTPAKTPSSKSWARLQYQSLQRDCDSLYATKNHVTMHQGVEIPALAPGDPLNDLKAGILSFHIAPSAAALHTTVQSHASPPLDDDRTVLAHAQQWAASTNSNRSSHRRIGELPWSLAALAVPATAAGAAQGTSRRLTWSIPEAALHERWEEDLKPAVIKELTGLKTNQVFEVVPRSSIPPGAPPVMRLRNLVEFRSDGTGKCRTVVVGSREKKGLHYLQSASPMVMTETVLMLISIGASEGMDGEQFDFAMAFTQAPCEEPDQYIELPDIPDAEHPHLGPSRGP